MRAIGRRRGSVRSESSKHLAFRIASISPSSVLAGAGATAIDINGGPWPSGALLFIDGSSVAVTRISSVLLQATVPSGVVAVPGFHSIQVIDATGHASNIWQWPISFPVPTFSAHSPTFGYVGEGGVAVSATGTGFYTPGTDATVDGSDVVTTFVDATHVSVAVPGGVVDVAGDHPVIITNPLPGGGNSSSRAFQGRYRAPTVVSLSPTGATLGAGNTTVTATVTNAYDAGAWAGGGSVISIDGTPVATTWLDATHVRFVVPSTVTAVGGAKAITMANPTAGSGGGTSSAVNFNVGFLAPTISSLSPNSITYTAPSTVVRVLGVNFYLGGNSVVNVNGSPIATTFINSGELQVTYSPSSVQDLSITVTNNTVGGGGGTSSAKTLSITPDVTAISPNTGYQYDASGIAATVTTAGALPTSVVSMGGAEVPTTFVSSTQLTISIPGTVSTNLGNVAVRVRNATGGPDSAASTTYFINTINPLTDLTHPYSGSWDGDNVQPDPVPRNPNDIIQAYDIVNGTNPFKNVSNVGQNPTDQADATLSNYNTVVFDGVSDYLGSNTGTNPLVSAMFPAADWVFFCVFKAASAANNNTTSANIYQNTQVFASDANPGVRCGLALVNNAGQMGVIFWLYDGAFKLSAKSTNCAFGSWAYVIVKKSGTSLTISVNGEAFLTPTTGVGNISATTQRCTLATAPPAAGNYKLAGSWRTLIIWPGTTTDIMRCQNYAHYLLGI